MKLLRSWRRLLFGSLHGRGLLRRHFFSRLFSRGFLGGDFLLDRRLLGRDLLRSSSLFRGRLLGGGLFSGRRLLLLFLGDDEGGLLERDLRGRAAGDDGPVDVGGRAECELGVVDQLLLARPVAVSKPCSPSNSSGS